MDFSYFTPSSQPYQFFRLPPTPAASSTSQPDDYGTSLSSDQYDAAFAAFQQNFHYDPATFLAQPNEIPQASPGPALRSNSVSSIPDMSGNGAPARSPDEQARRSSSEEKEGLTPAQSRRKAQNRAAQRAFRERKERHVKNLEAKMTNLEQHSAMLNGENERLKRELAKVATENKILRATSGNPSAEPHSFVIESDNLLSTGPMTWRPTDRTQLPSTAVEGQGNAATSLSPRAEFAVLHRKTVADDTGQALLPAGAAWDYIQAHELFRKGLVDVGDVCERLKKVARCDGQGPVFEEGDVLRAITESAVAGGRDELI